MKKILALAASVVMLFNFTLHAEAGFNWGGIANKAANKAVDSVLSSGKKQTNTNKQKQEQKTKADNAASSQTSGNKTAAEENGSVPTAFVGTLDPLPPDVLEERPDWFDKRTSIWAMTNGRLVAEYENMGQWRTYAQETGIGWVEPDMFRYEEFGTEIQHRIRAVGRYTNKIEAGWTDMAVAVSQEATYKRAVASNLEPLRKYGLDDDTTMLIGYHPERN